MRFNFLIIIRLVTNFVILYSAFCKKIRKKDQLLPHYCIANLLKSTNICPFVHNCVQPKYQKICEKNDDRFFLNFVIVE
jgi:hypothetical protein